MTSHYSVVAFSICEFFWLCVLLKKTEKARMKVYWEWFFIRLAFRRCWGC